MAHYVHFGYENTKCEEILCSTSDESNSIASEMSRARARDGRVNIAEIVDFIIRMISVIQIIFVDISWTGEVIKENTTYCIPLNKVKTK